MKICIRSKKIWLMLLESLNRINLFKIIANKKKDKQWNSKGIFKLNDNIIIYFMLFLQMKIVTPHI